jgi:transcriptional regulator of acetoin/glycerol metabolism
MQIKPEVQQSWAALKPALETMLQSSFTLYEVRDMTMRAYVETAITVSNGNVSEAGRKIKVHRNTIYRYTDKR